MNTDDAPVHYNSREAAAWVIGYEAASTAAEVERVTEDLTYRLNRRNEDAVRVHQALVPLLVDVFPYNLDIKGDTDDLRPGFVASVAAQRITDQAGQIELLKAEVSARSGITLTVQRNLELMQAQRDRALNRVDVLETTAKVRQGITDRADEKIAALEAEIARLKDRELRLPDDWCDEMKIIMRDPDGWRLFSRLGEKDWDVPITREEFLQRMGSSTVQPLPGSNWGRA